MRCTTKTYHAVANVGYFVWLVNCANFVSNKVRVRQTINDSSFNHNLDTTACLWM